MAVIKKTPKGLDKRLNIAQIYPNDQKSLMHYFYQNLSYKENKVAISTNSKSITYSELSTLIQTYSGYFSDYGIRKGSIAAVHLERSVESIVTQLALYQLGAIYFPLDLNQPESKINSMLTSVEVSHLISQSHKACIRDAQKYQTIIVDEIKISLNKSASNAIYNQDLYIMFTSGSTGFPKPILCSHDGLLNRLNWYLQKYPYYEDDVVCHKTRLGFVDSVTEILAPLLAGVSLSIFTEEEVLETTSFISLLQSRNVTRLTLVPSFLEKIITIDESNNLKNLRQVVSSGEKLPENIIRVFISKYPNVSLLNLYGTSEISGDVTFQEINSKTPYYLHNKIGKPIPNIDVLLVDENNIPVIDGHPGELCVSGVALAHGYINTDMIPSNDKFAHIKVNGSIKRIFKTGDIALRDLNGDIEYLGRIDNQIKIDGNRFNLIEVESALKSHPEIEDCIVIYDDLSKRKKLLAFFVCKYPSDTFETAKDWHFEEDRIFNEDLLGKISDQILIFQNSVKPYDFIRDSLKANSAKNDVFQKWLGNKTFNHIFEFTTAMVSSLLTISDQIQIPITSFVYSVEQFKILDNISKFMNVNNFSHRVIKLLNIDLRDSYEYQLLHLNNLTEYFLSLSQLERFLFSLTHRLNNSTIYISNIFDFEYAIQLNEKYLFQNNPEKIKESDESLFKYLTTANKLFLSQSYFLSLKKKLISISKIEILTNHQTEYVKYFDVAIHISDKIHQSNIHVNDKATKSSLASYSDHALSTKSIYNFISKKIPNYMLPMYLIQVKEIQLNSNGKRDRNFYNQFKHIGNFKYKAPCGNRTEFFISKIWSKIFNLDYIPPELTLTNIGANSIELVELISSINSDFKIKINVGWLLTHNSIEKQTQAILLNHMHKSLSYQAIIPFNESPGKIPLIMIHPALIGAETYTNMANLLNKEIPFYAVDSYNLYHEDPLSSVTKLSEYYANEIMLRIKSNELYLGGWSMGAILAYETAKLLKIKGLVVHGLFMIDPGNPSLDKTSNIKKMLTDEIQFMNNLPSYLRSYINEIPSSISRKMISNMQLELEMLINHHGSPDNFSIRIFHASEVIDNDLCQSSEDVLYNWNKYSNDLRVFSVQCNHFSIMEHKHTKFICKQIEEEIINGPRQCHLSVEDS